MDTVLFLKTISRMCSSYDSECDGCPIVIEMKRKGEDLDCYGFIKLYIEEVVEIVERWIKEHPIKTRSLMLLEIFPETLINEEGVPNICPLKVGAEIKCSGQCDECCKEFWMEEVEW